MLFFCSFRELLTRLAQCKENCAASKGGMKSMKSPCFAISILQQPNVFKSKMLPPWMRSRTEWVLAAESVSFPKKQNSKITDSTHVAPSEILNHPNRSLFPKWRTQSLCLPSAKGKDGGQGWKLEWIFTYFKIISDVLTFCLLLYSLINK